MLFSEPKTALSRTGAEQKEIYAAGDACTTFQQSVQHKDLVPFFRSMCKELEEGRGLTHYHMKVQNNFDHHAKRPLPGWGVTVIYGGADEEDEEAGPLDVNRCMSCDLECPLRLGVTGSEGEGGPLSRDSLIRESEHCRVWLDAKARPMIVITPKVHRERMSELSDGELRDLWAVAVADMASLGMRKSNCAILNHGNARNHAHLHLKVRFSPWDWQRAVRQAHPRLQGQLKVLDEFASTLPTKGCRPGHSRISDATQQPPCKRGIQKLPH